MECRVVQSAGQPSRLLSSAARSPRPPETNWSATVVERVGGHSWISPEGPVSDAPERPSLTQGASAAPCRRHAKVTAASHVPNPTQRQFEPSNITRRDNPQPADLCTPCACQTRQDASATARPMDPAAIRQQTAGRRRTVGGIPMRSASGVTPTPDHTATVASSSVATTPARRGVLSRLRSMPVARSVR